MVDWVLDNSLNFIPQAVGGFAALLILASLIYRRRWPLVMAAILIVGLVLSLTVLKSSLSAPAPAGARLRVMTANLLFDNQDISAFAQTLRSLDPDVLVVQERGEFWDAVFEKVLRRDYELSAESESKETAVYHKPRIASCDVPAVRTKLHPRVALDCVEIAGQPVLVLAAHAPRPGSPLESAERTTTLTQYDAIIAEVGMPVIVAGDHNASAMLPSFRDYLHRAHLSMPSEPGAWFAATWPSEYPAIGIRIDHILTTPELGSSLVAAGPDIGSNHLPLTADVGFRGR